MGPQQLARRDSGGFDGVVFIIIVVSELTLRDSLEVLGEESWDAIVSTDKRGGGVAIQGTQEAEKQAGNSEESRCLGMGVRTTCYREVK